MGELIRAATVVLTALVVGFIVGTTLDLFHYRRIIARQRRLLAEYQRELWSGGITCPECGGEPWADDGECCFVCEGSASCPFIPRVQRDCEAAGGGEGMRRSVRVQTPYQGEVYAHRDKNSTRHIYMEVCDRPGHGKSVFVTLRQARRFAKAILEMVGEEEGKG